MEGKGKPLQLAHVSPATRLLEKRRQMFQVQEALEAQKEEFARREDAFRRREDGLRKKDLELQESLIKFNKFLQENEAKRNRAIKRASDEKKQRQGKENEIVNLDKGFEEQVHENAKLQALVARNVKYAKFLEMVQETVSEDYPEISDLVNRYNTLKEVNIDLSKNQQFHEKECDVKRVEFGTYTKERANDILTYNNEIARLQKEIEVSESVLFKLQHAVDSNLRGSSDKTLKLGQIFLTIGNLLQRCTGGIHGMILKHTDLKQLEELDGEELRARGQKAMGDLDIISAYMTDFMNIVESRIEKRKNTNEMNDRLVPYRNRMPQIVADRLQLLDTQTMYLLQTVGPTCYVIKQDDVNYRVRIGSRMLCSCNEKDLCIHVLYVMNKILRVPRSNPLIWQRSLVDTEVTQVLQVQTQPKAKKKAINYLRKSTVEDTSNVVPDLVDVRLEVVDGEVCAICQDEMNESDKPLTYCKTGCGNNFHLECMKIYGESRKQSKETVICPLCRVDWGFSALTTLIKETRKASLADNVHKVSCRSCKRRPIYGKRYRCIQCKSRDQCERCYVKKMHNKHDFVVKETKNGAWSPAPYTTQHQTLTEEQIEDMQQRELSTADYNALVELDTRQYHTLHDYLLDHAPGQVLLATDSCLGRLPSCISCHQHLAADSHIRVLPCEHYIHQSCLLQHFMTLNYVCPSIECESILFPGLRKSKPVETSKVLQTPMIERVESSFQPDISTLAIGMPSIAMQPIATVKARKRIRKAQVRGKAVVDTLASMSVKSQGITSIKPETTSDDDSLEHRISQAQKWRLEQVQTKASALKLGNANRHAKVHDRRHASNNNQLEKLVVGDRFATSRISENINVCKTKSKKPLKPQKIQTSPDFDLRVENTAALSCKVQTNNIKLPLVPQQLRAKMKNTKFEPCIDNLPGLCGRGL